MFSRIVRRTHMYLALFLTPWVLMYALSTIAMNHRSGAEQAFEKESARRYEAAFSDAATPRQRAAQILQDLGLDGAYSVSKASDGGLAINRMDPVTPRRIVYRPSENLVTVERMVFRMPAFLERMHRRRGFQQDYAADDAWAVSVDLFIAALIFWSASGVWMWWEMRVTRRTGAMFAAAGAALFAAFLASI